MRVNFDARRVAIEGTRMTFDARRVAIEGTRPPVASDAKRGSALKPGERALVPGGDSD
jgi:hypothetical protein